MAYYLIISFIIFITVDYKMIYTFVDSKILYSTSGSKLHREIGNESEIKKIAKEFLSYTVIDWSILSALILIFFFTSYTISEYAFSINPLYLSIFSKQFNLTDICSSISKEFKIIYNISQLIFWILIVFHNRIRIINKCKRLIVPLMPVKEQEEEREEQFVIARTDEDECFSICENGLYQNVLITGSIGSGKTSGAIFRICYNLIKSGKGGLILDVKGNFVDTVEQICARTKRSESLRIISKTSEYMFDILDDNLSSLELAGRIKQVITLLSGGGNTDPYWLDKVENVLMNFFVLMRYYNNKLDIMLLHKMTTDNTYLKQLLTLIKQKAKEHPPSEKESFELANAITFVEKELLSIDGRVGSIIRSEITRFTIPLITEYDIYNQFCNPNNKKKITFANNEIVVLSINIGENKTLAKIIATCLKLFYQKHILSNINNCSSNFFIADEFQEFCNAEDSHFLSLSREAKCINVISTQSYSSLRNALKDSCSANVIIQNLVNKIWFRNDDNYTISEAIKQLGKVYKIRENTSISESGQESRKYILKQGFKNKKSGISKTLSYVSEKENEYDENFFSRELKTFEALAFISDGNKMLDAKKIIFERWV